MEGREEGRVPEQTRSGHRNIEDQENCLCPQGPGTSMSQRKPSLVSSRAGGRTGEPWRKAGREEAGARLPFHTAPTLRAARRSSGPVV